MEMLVGPLLVSWVPGWVVEQHERGNPYFREYVEKSLRQDERRALTNRQLLVRVRRRMQSRLERVLSARESRRLRGLGEEDEASREGSSQGAGSGEDSEEAQCRRPLGSRRRRVLRRMRSVSHARRTHPWRMARLHTVASLWTWTRRRASVLPALRPPRQISVLWVPVEPRWTRSEVP